MDNPIQIICGPTGSGKTAIALDLAKDFPLEVISADSRQIIKYLNIGTAKPNAEEQEHLKFHLVDIIQPGDRYSAFRFVNEAEQAIVDIISRGRIPIIVGGTGLYLQALSEGVIEISEQDMQLRERLEKEAAEQGSSVMHKRLEKIDPLEAARTHPHNQVRIIRALEIFHLTGKTKSELLARDAQNKNKNNYAFHCLAMPRDQLYNRINARVDAMMREGLLDELRQLINRGMTDRVRKANVIGYSELLDYIDGNCSIEEAVSMIKQNTRRYAKRQMTWFRHQAQCSFYSDADSLRLSLAEGLRFSGK